MQPLQVKLVGDPQVQGRVERVVMGRERPARPLPRRRAAAPESRLPETRADPGSSADTGRCARDRRRPPGTRGGRRGPRSAGGSGTPGPRPGGTREPPPPPRPPCPGEAAAAPWRAPRSPWRDGHLPGLRPKQLACDADEVAEVEAVETDRTSPRPARPDADTPGSGRSNRRRARRPSCRAIESRPPAPRSAP